MLGEGKFETHKVPLQKKSQAKRWSLSFVCYVTILNFLDIAESFIRGAEENIAYSFWRFGG
jgi:hypothetical protein